MRVGGATATQRRVRYDCSQGGRCDRSEGVAGGATSNAKVVVEDVQNSAGCR